MVNSRETVGAVWTECQQLCPQRDSFGGMGKAPAAGVCLVMVKCGNSILFVARGVNGPQAGLTRLSGHESVSKQAALHCQQPCGHCQRSVSGNLPQKVQVSLFPSWGRGRVSSVQD